MEYFKRYSNEMLNTYPIMSTRAMYKNIPPVYTKMIEFLHN